MKKRNWNLTEKQQNIYENLKKQIDKVFDFRRKQQGFRGLEKYRAECYEFAKHLAKNYSSKNFKNISDKHLHSFVEESKKFGIQSSLNTSLSAIRKLHKLTEGTRFELSNDNKVFSLNRRSSRGVDRAWTDREVQSAIGLARATGRHDVANAIGLGRTVGCRINESTRLRYEDLKDAVRNDYLLLRGKGGINRDVPLTNQAKVIIQDMLKHSDGEKGYVFIQHGRNHKQAKDSIRDWIYNHRNEFKEDYVPDRKYQQQLQIDIERGNLSYHGLRHAFARENYQQRLKKGLSEKEARVEVSVLLGHGRDDVTRIYT
jgi:integrase/recombinase XerD